MVNARALRCTSEGSNVDHTQTGDRYLELKRWYLEVGLWPLACLPFIVQVREFRPRYILI